LIGTVLIFFIRQYQKYLSPHLGKNCRFIPTCSQYAIEAIQEWGTLCGTFLAIRRVLRCNPFGGQGYDPVPPRKRKKRQRLNKPQ